MNLSKYLVSRKTLFFLFILIAFCVFIPINSAKANTTYINDVPCGMATGYSGPALCDIDITMNNDTPYTTGDFLNVSLHQSSSGYLNSVPQTVKFDGTEGTYNTCGNPNGCTRALTYTSGPWHAQSDNCYVMNVFYQWPSGYSMTTGIPYTVGTGCEGGGNNNNNGGGYGSPVISISSDPPQIFLGETSTINWVTSGADSCDLKEGQNLLANGLTGPFVVTPENLGLHTYSLDCVKNLESLGPKQNYFAKSNNYFNKFKQIISSLTQKASAEDVSQLWSHGETTVEVLPPSPPTVDLSFSNCPSYPCEALVGEIKSGIILHPDTTSCILTSSPSMVPPIPSDCQTATVFANPFYFSTGPFPSAGNYVFTVVGSNTGGNDTDSKTITVTENFPDLRAEIPPQSSAQVNVSKTFSSGIGDLSTAPTIIPFHNIFQVATSSTGAGALSFNSTPPSPMPALNGYASARADASYTFPSVGTWYVRFCADSDINNNMAGVIDEGPDEGNNCSSIWRPVDVSPDAKPDLTASPTSPPPATTATVGIPKTFTSTITNEGDAATNYQGVNTFKNVFRVAPGINGGGGSTPFDTAPAHMTNLTKDGGHADASYTYTFTTTGTHSFQFCADKDTAMAGTITESDEDNNCSYWTNVEVSPTPKPDLVASNPTPTSAVPGVAQTFTSTIKNQGDAATNYLGVTTFTNLFQTSTQSNGSNPTDYPTSVMTTIFAQGTKTATSPPITFPSSFGQNTYYIQACADKSSAANTGTINESIENNNCSGWIDITMSPVPQPDLIAGAPAQTTAVTNVPKTFTSTITNQGTAGTGASFYNSLQVAPGPNGWGASIPPPLIASTPSPMSALPASGSFGSSAMATASHTFTANECLNGQKCSVRFCADNNINMIGTIAESSEGNNCSAWVNVSILPTAQPDLIAGAPPQTTAVINVPKTFTSTITNQGTAGTGASFYNSLQVATGPNGVVAQFPLIVSTPSPMGALDVAGSLIGSSAMATATYTFTTTGTKSVRFCADNNDKMVGTITESDEGNNCSAWVSVSVPPAQPDLIASNPTPTVAVVGVAKTFTSTITNQGDADTDYQGVTTFANLFQTSTLPNGGGTVAGYKVVPDMTTILAGGTKTTASPPITFPSAGTYYMRACADKSSAANTGTITESDEGNNCSSAWTKVDVVTISVSLTADPVSMLLPTNTTILTWAVAGTPDTCSASGDWSGLKAATNGNHTESITGLDAGPPSPHTYTFDITCEKVGVANAFASVSVKVYENDKLDGVCSPTHYFCATPGNSTNNLENPTNWTWDCEGTNGGTTASCSESKNSPVNGVCDCPHYDCISGNSINYHQSLTDWTWTCQGSQNTTPKGTDDSCTEPIGGGCPAGLTPYPACDTCINNATNPPACTDFGKCLNPLWTPYPACDTCINDETYPDCLGIGGKCINPLYTNYSACDKCVNNGTFPICKKIPRWWEI